MAPDHRAHHSLGLGQKTDPPPVADQLVACGWPESGLPGDSRGGGLLEGPGDHLWFFKPSGRHTLRDWVERYWWGIRNAQAVRNRLRLVRRELDRASREVASLRRRPLHLVSLASGSARAVIETVACLRARGTPAVATLIDLDPEALRAGEALAARLGVERWIRGVCASVSHMEKVLDAPPDLVEMVGFLDYRPDHRAVSLIRRIHRILEPGGWFITANILPNAEQHSLKIVIDWPMIYRRPEELGALLLQGGFVPEVVTIRVEPQRIHAVSVCHKGG